MRAGRAVGVAVTVLAAAFLAAFWQDPGLVAAGQQTAAQSQAAGQPKVQKQIVTVQKQAGESPRVVTHGFVGEAPLVAALAGGGPRLGVQVRDVAKVDLAKLKLPAQSGVVIDEVMNETAAQKAGVKAGDVVVQFDGENVRSAQQFTRLVRETAEGRTVKMAVIRDGKRLDLDVTPTAADDSISMFVNGNRIRGDIERQLTNAQEQAQQYHFERRVPGPPPEPGPLPHSGTLQWKEEAPGRMLHEDMLRGFGDTMGNFAFYMGRGRLGVTVQELTADLATYFGVKDGLLVSAVQEDSPAAKAGIKAGDVIGAVNGKTVSSSSELIEELADKDGEVTIGLTRDRKPLSLKATLETRKPPARHTIVTGRPA
jgi:serine protease Do